MPDITDIEEPIRNALRLGGLVKDWGGFEKLVAELNQTGNVSVAHDVTLIGKSGAPRQTDVVIRHTQGLIEHLVIVDCKHWKQRVGRLHVDALATAVRDLSASRGVLFSVVGFESGAITLAKAEGIDLFTVRELTDNEWGLPGRYVDFFIACISKSIRNPTFPGATAYSVGPAVHLNLRFGPDDTSTKTPIEPYPGLSDATFESLMEGIAAQVAQQVWKPEKLFDGLPGQRSFWKHADVAFNGPVVVPQGFGKVFISKMSFDIGVRIHQSRFQMDRGARYVFALAVEDCVRGVTRSAARSKDEPFTVVSPVRVEERQDEEPMRNGSILVVMLKGFFDFDELAGLQNGEFRDELDRGAASADVPGDKGQ